MDRCFAVYPGGCVPEQPTLIGVKPSVETGLLRPDYSESGSLVGGEYLEYQDSFQF